MTAMAQRAGIDIGAQPDLCTGSVLTPFFLMKRAELLRTMLAIAENTSGDETHRLLAGAVASQLQDASAQPLASFMFRQKDVTFELGQACASFAHGHKLEIATRILEIPETGGDVLMVTLSWKGYV